MISLRNLERFYETPAGRSYVLRRINLDVKEGEFVTVMGPSGAGKSTLLAILGMLDASWTGEFQFLDQPGNDLELLKILLSEIGDVGLYYIEQFGDYQGYSAEVPGPGFPFQHLI